MRRPRILLAASLDEASEARLGSAAEVVRSRGPDEAALRAAVAGCDALVARTHTPVTRAVLAAGDRLRVVGVAGVGVDRVDLDAARELGIEVLHTPAAASDAVAEFTVLLMLQLLRPVGRLSEMYRRGEFAAARNAAHGRELRGLTVGIVGLGRIGSRVGRLCAAGFGARLLYNDIIDVGPVEYSAERVDKPRLWSECDVITLHVPLTEKTRRMVDEQVLRQMRREAVLVNTARGAVVDTAALGEALRDGAIGGAALDVTEPEPLPTDHALWSCDRCLITPHIAARTVQGLQNMYAIVEDVIAFLRGRGATP